MTNSVNQRMKANHFLIALLNGMAMEVLARRYGQLVVFYLEKALPLFTVTREAMRLEVKDI